MDGSFKVEPLARAVIGVLRRPGDALVSKAVDDDRVIAWGDYVEFWDAMIDQLLADGDDLGVARDTAMRPGVQLPAGPITWGKKS